ncbi:dethiobiotin synthase [Acidothermus cellulolyticus 11B]|uniref:ATP-dependent dethiobiotin synthetase BioD n=1 Tax=Acidothermus cellulolyticus (strain ATCC 43068 / DSM 8971 / 11B) TaxID=351607 RepID=A0LTR5_ACIC1|nr:dethiobiotin synthase [Acidothermus cellulolyticus]ABK52825.1 dethiobiotin synthase [Acidothermus cellulolyticus 11B]
MGEAGIRGIVVITGTDTGVGKTIATAAIAAAATAGDMRVAVVKPCQTGVAAGDEPDVEVVARLADPALTKTLATYGPALAPTVAARLTGAPLIRMHDVAREVRAIATHHDLVLVEGAGGLLVPMGERNWTVADLAVELGASVVVAVRASLGTLNHTALTLEALARRGIRGMVVIGSWPVDPEVVHRTNLRELPEISGVIPEAVGSLGGATFRSAAHEWLAPRLHGSLDVAEFVAREGG